MRWREHNRLGDRLDEYASRVAARGASASKTVSRDALRDPGSKIAKSRKLHFLEHFRPKPKPHDLVSDRQQRILAGLSLVCVGISAAAVGMDSYAGTTQGVIAGAVTGVCGLALMGGVRAGGRPAPLGNKMMSATYGLSTGLTIVSGGETVTAIFAALLTASSETMVARWFSMAQPRRGRRSHLNCRLTLNQPRAITIRIAFELS